MARKESRRTKRAISPIVALVCLFLLGGLHAPAAQDVWTGIGRIVAVGDVHGDYDQLVSVLRSAGVIDGKGKWIGGKTHLVQMGDVVDRGPASRKAMDLLMALEKQARNAGGYVHALIGNHEAMNVYGDLRYTTPAEYDAFRDRDSEKLRDLFWQMYLEQLQASSPKAKVDAAYRAKWEAEHPLGFVEHRQQFAPQGTYGKWILSHNAAVRINDILFVHGGISPAYVSTPLRQINDRIRGELQDFAKLNGGMAMDEEGPLWYRGLMEDEEGPLWRQVDTVLSNFGVTRIVVGHSTTAGAVTPRFEGKVIGIDVGLSRVYGGPPACLLIESGRFYVLHRGSKLELPSGPGADAAAYLKRAEALEPQGSRLNKARSLPEPRPAVK
jgi:hypothetical protein